MDKKAIQEKLDTVVRQMKLTETAYHQLLGQKILLEEMLNPKDEKKDA